MHRYRLALNAEGELDRIVFRYDIPDDDVLIVDVLSFKRVSGI